jgi:hypothetical protein
MPIPMPKDEERAAAEERARLEQERRLGKPREAHYPRETDRVAQAEQKLAAMPQDQRKQTMLWLADRFDRQDDERRAAEKQRAHWQQHREKLLRKARQDSASTCCVM